MEATTRGGRSWPAPILWLVGGITLAGLLLRLSSFDDSMFADELSTYFVVHGFGTGDVMDLVNGKQESTPPLYYKLAELTNGSDQGLRLVPMLAGVSSIPLTYVLGRKTVGEWPGVVGAALVALSPFLIFYSTEARGYSLAMACALFSTLALVYALQTHNRWWWVLYALASAGAVYSHYTVVFVLAAQFAWAFLFHPEARKGLVLSNLGAVVLYLPWVPGFLEDRNQPAAKLIDVAHPFNLDAFGNDLVHFTIAHPQTQVSEMPGELVVWGIAAGMLIALVALGVRIWSEGWGDWRPSSWVTLIVLLAVATPLGAALYSIPFASVYLPRNLIPSWPAFALALGALLVAARGWPRVVALVLTIGGLGVGALNMQDVDQQRPDTKGVVDFIEANSAPSDPVVEEPLPTPGPQTALEAYMAPYGEGYPDRNPVMGIPGPPLETRIRNHGPNGVGPIARIPAPSTEEVARRAAAMAEGGKVFLVTWGPEQSFDELRASLLGTPAAFARALPPRFRGVERRTFPGFGPFQMTVYVFEDAGRPAPA